MKRDLPKYLRESAKWLEGVEDQESPSPHENYDENREPTSAYYSITPEQYSPTLCKFYHFFTNNAI
jgi:hypothetical protein